MKLIRNIILIFIILSVTAVAETKDEFDNWKKQFKVTALENQISEKTFDITMLNVKFLPKVIQYDRFQPEFYEDTISYITKRTSNDKIINGIIKETKISTR